ncbi:hypothetical protein DB347_18230 [Opitutaceae bacterium EW11]|nr:hypothetical protein DB347_18230 [Opitutaceae bacterium EW11]
MKLRTSTASLFVFLALSTILVLTSWSFLRSPVHEEGDAALNALQIERAKSFQEIHGNYSRFHFNHPGPAFFYVDAAAEAVLTDRLHLMSPNCAHTLANMLLQAAFLSLTLYLLASLFEQPLFIPLALLGGAIHFARAGQAFTSIWPPHVLLMPFLAFWASCVSVGNGRGRHLPWLALTGSFLVHGHVAQPLFVVSLTVLSYAALWLQARRPMPVRAFPWAHAGALLVIALFVLPLAIDLTHGDESNFHAIMTHLRTAGDHKRLSKAAVYFLSFFSYTRDQDELLRSLSLDSLSFIRQRPWPFVAWMAIAALVGVGAWRGFGAAPERLRRIRIAAGFWGATALLCLVWGVMQSGAMYDFNGYFYYGVNYALLLIGCGLVAQWVPAGASRWIGAGAVLAAVPLAWNGFSLGGPPSEDKGMIVRRHTLEVLAADPHPEAPKLLVFPHDDWPMIASVALALQRAGVQFYVDPSWTFMFQRHHEMPAKTAADVKTKLSIWRFLHNTDAPGVPFQPGVTVVFDAPTLSPSNGVIDFSADGNFERYQVFGFSTPLPGEFAPTAQNDAILIFKPEPAEKDIELEIIAIPYFAPGQPHIQPSELRFNGELVFAAPFTEPGVLRARVPKELWNSRPEAIVHLSLPNAQSPAELGLSADPRRLGLMVKKLTTRLGDK